MLESVSADKVANDDTPLAEEAVFEANNNHPVPLKTSTPTFVAVLCRDAVRGDEPEVTRCADVVVAIMALWAVEAGRGR